MFGRKIKFRVIAPPVDVMAREVSKRLKICGFEVDDVLKSEIFKKSDNTKVVEGYILCCKGYKRAYEEFKKLYELDESIHKGIKTLIWKEKA
jgi:hypothetical protein